MMPLSQDPNDWPIDPCIQQVIQAHFHLCEQFMAVLVAHLVIVPSNFLTSPTMKVYCGLEVEQSIKSGWSISPVLTLPVTILSRVLHVYEGMERFPQISHFAYNNSA